MSGTLTKVNFTHEAVEVLLTDDLSARVVRRDGDSACGTLGRFLQPHFHTGRAEHVVVGTDHRLSDLQTAHSPKEHRHKRALEQTLPS